MSTLKELWLANGEKPGLKVTRHDIEGWFCILAITPHGALVGYLEDGTVTHYGIYTTDWELFQEPKSKIYTEYLVTPKTGVSSLRPCIEWKYGHFVPNPDHRYTKLREVEVEE